MQHAEHTLSSRRSNAMNIAGLEIALLRASDIPARYVHRAPARSGVPLAAAEYGEIQPILHALRQMLPCKALPDHGRIPDEITGIRSTGSQVLIL